MDESNVLSVCQAGEYLSVYRMPLEDRKFTFGKLLCANEDFYALLAYDRDGSDDGIQVKQSKKVVRIEKDGLYGQKMKQLIGTDKVPGEFVCDREDILQFYLKLAKKRQWIVSIELLESGYDDVMGFVDTIDEGLCTVFQVDEYGKSDGVTFFSCEDITAVACNTEDEKIPLTLWRMQNECKGEL